MATSTAEVEVEVEQGKTAKGTAKRRAPRPLHGVWSSRRSFLLAAIGSVIWLNNLYQVPELAGQYGGGAFLLVYVAGLALLGLPLVMSELVLGQLGRESAPQSILLAVKRAGGDARWRWLGWAAIVIGFLVFSYYSVIGGWALAYAVRSAVGGFAGRTEDGISAIFAAFFNDPEKQLFWHSLFIGVTMLVVASGLHKGIEVLTRWLVPAIFVLLLVFVGYAATLDTFAAGATRFLAPDFSRLSLEGVLLALGHAFFGLGLGLGALMAYGARLPKDMPVGRLSLVIIGADFAAVLLAGLALFPILLAADLTAPAGATILFQTIPLALDLLPAGVFMSVLFFVLVVFVAWTSAISFIEPLMLWLVERFRVNRHRLALWVGGAVWLVGVIVILSFNYWAFDFSFFGAAKHYGFFDILLIATNLLLPLFGGVLALFVGWRLSKVFTREALRIESLCVYDVWLWSLRILIPVVLLIVFFNLPRLFL